MVNKCKQCDFSCHDYAYLRQHIEQEHSTPVMPTESNLDQILENLVIATANQYGGYEGRDEETEEDIKKAKQAIQALYNTEEKR